MKPLVNCLGAIKSYADSKAIFLEAFTIIKLGCYA